MAFREIKQYDSTFPVKLLFRILLIIFVWVAVGLLGYFISQLSYVLSPWSLVVSFTVCPLGVVFWWSFITQLISLVRRRPVHPGVYVAIDLILVVLVGAMAILATAVMSTRLTCLHDTAGDYALITDACMSTFNWEDNGDSDSRWYYGAYDYYGYGVYDDADFNRYLKQLDTITIVGCAFGILVAALEFILFVWACVDIPRYNKQKKNMQSQIGNQMGWNNNMQQVGYGQQPVGYGQQLGGHGHGQQPAMYYGQYSVPQQNYSVSPDK